jgi:hypothetical protein
VKRAVRKKNPISQYTPKATSLLLQFSAIFCVILLAWISRGCLHGVQPGPEPVIKLSKKCFFSLINSNNINSWHLDDIVRDSQVSLLESVETGYSYIWQWRLLSGYYRQAHGVNRLHGAYNVHRDQLQFSVLNSFFLTYTIQLSSIHSDHDSSTRKPHIYHQRESDKHKV